MKNFTIATILFIILLITTFFNSVFISSRCEYLSGLAKKIPSVSEQECKKELDEFKSEWDDFKKIATFTVAYSELNKISCAIDELYVHLSNSNDIDFDHTLAVMINSIIELSRHERFCFENIF